MELVVAQGGDRLPDRLDECGNEDGDKCECGVQQMEHAQQQCNTQRRCQQYTLANGDLGCGSSAGLAAGYAGEDGSAFMQRQSDD